AMHNAAGIKRLHQYIHRETVRRSVVGRRIENGLTTAVGHQFPCAISRVQLIMFVECADQFIDGVSGLPAPGFSSHHRRSSRASWDSAVFATTCVVFIVVAG